MTFLETVAANPVDRLPSAIDLWLWEFEDLANCPTLADAEPLSRPFKQADAARPLVIRAVTRCRAYLTPG